MYQIFGVGNPLMDILAKVSFSFLEEKKLKPGSMQLVELQEQSQLLASLKEEKPLYDLGGSCANTMVGLSQLGAVVGFCGKVGQDKEASLYEAALKKENVSSHLSKGLAATGSTLVLVSPDGQRTMNTHLGASQELSPEDAPKALHEKTDLLYLTLYVWDNPQGPALAERLVSTFHQNRKPVALSLSDAFCVERNGAKLLDKILPSLDILFANEEEACSLSKTSTAKEALEKLSKEIPEVVITRGAEGALLFARGEQKEISAFPCDVQDTTGAGDAFASGYLWGRLQGASLENRGKCGALFASRIIQQFGARLSHQEGVALSKTLAEKYLLKN